VEHARFRERHECKAEEMGKKVITSAYARQDILWNPQKSWSQSASKQCLDGDINGAQGIFHRAWLDGVVLLDAGD
jgi:hypothetical protein